MHKTPGKWLDSKLLNPIVVLTWGIGILCASRVLPGFEILELQTQSLFLSIRGTVAPPKDIIILAIDELSLNQGEFYDPKTRPYLEPIQQFPWKRSAYAFAIDRLMAAGAKVVAIDLLFAEPSIYGPEDDGRIAASFARHQQKLVLAASYEISSSQEGRLEKRISPLEVYPELTPPIEGFVNLVRAKDSSVRKLAVARSGEKTFVEAILHQGNLKFQTPQNAGINYFGQEGTWLRAGQQYPFYYLLDPQNWRSVLENGAVFRDKIVIIGATANSLQDIQPSPVGPMPGVEIHSHALATLLTNRSVQIPSMGINTVLVLGWAVGVGWLLSFCRQSQYQFLAALGLGLIAVGGGFLVWNMGNIFIPVGLMAVSTLGIGTTQLIFGVLREQLKLIQSDSARKKLRDTLELYVAAPIVGEILNQPENYYALLAGKSIEAVVMFSDIRGFTTYSNILPPRELVEQLNVYLSGMVEVIIANQGTVDKFMGDAIMAEFGSPISKGAAQDVMAAINCALGMRQALHQLRQDWEKAGKIPFFHGIGLHFGEVIVGNIGSPQRLEYAVIGDTVNVSSRIEGMTKVLGYDILLSEAVYVLAAPEVEVVDLGEHELRGRSGVIRLYGLIGLKGDDREIFDYLRSAKP